MINEVDESVRNLIRAEVVNGADVDVLFDAPTREWAARRNTPTVDMYLYDIREDIRRRQIGMIDRRDEQGVVVERRDVPRFFKLAYLITAWTQRTEDEHRLLSAVLACFMRHDFLPESALTPVLREVGSPLQVTIAFPPPEDRQVSDVWSSLGGDLKPSVDLVVTIAMAPDTFFEIAQAATEPLRLKSSGHTTFDVEDEPRQLRRAPATAPASAAPAEEESPAPVSGARARKRTRSQDS